MKFFLVSILFLISLSSIARAGDLEGLLGVSFADEFDSDSGDVESDAAFVLGIRYKHDLEGGFGFNAGIGLDSIRELEGTNAELGFFLLEGNATLAIDQIKALYIFAGLNYPMIVYEDKNLSDVDPSFGIQFGSGFNITNNAGFEIGYRTVNFEFGTTDYSLWGFSVRGFYTFAGF